jgi:hypothetical protein
MAVLLAYGPHLLSQGTSGWLSVGTHVPHTSGHHTDGILGLATEANETTVAFAVDLGFPRVPNIMGFFNHNITTGVTRVQACSAATFDHLATDLLVSVSGSASLSGSSNAWVDLRGVTGSSRYWRGLVTGNAEPVRLGELVVATVLTVQSYQWEYTDTRDYLHRQQGTTDFGVLVRQPQAIVVRSREVRWAGDNTLADTLQRVSDYAGRYPGPVIVIPDDSDLTDAWFVDWPEEVTRMQVAVNRQECRLLLQEQSPGAN